MAYFDNAATTYPKPEIVYQSMDQFQRHTGGSFGRGNYGFSSSAKSIVDDTRAASNNFFIALQNRLSLSHQLPSLLTLSFRELSKKAQGTYT